MSNPFSFGNKELFFSACPFGVSANSYKMNNTKQILFNDMNEKQICDIISDNFTAENKICFDQIILHNLPVDFLYNEIYGEIKNKIKSNYYADTLNYHYDKKQITIYFSLNKSVFCNSNVNNNVNIIKNSYTYNFTFSECLLSIDINHHHDVLNNMRYGSFSVVGTPKMPQCIFNVHQIMKKQSEEPKVGQKRERE
jgi:hypothetical protein